MKKILASLLVLAMCAPAMAATVTFVDNGNGTGTFTVTADGATNIVGLGLNVDVTAGGNITAATVDTATFDIFPDAARDLEVAVPGSYTYGAGTPIANQDTVGEAAISNSFAISVGALNGASTPGATGAPAVDITIAVDATTTVCIEENALRGGIVLTDGTGEDIVGTTVCGDIVVGSVICDGSGDAAFEAEYTAAVNAGLDPACWCEPRQCRGDADNAVEGKSNAYCAANDLNILLAAWNLPIDQIASPADICADFDRLPEGKSAARVAANDLNILLANWNLSLDTAPPAPCALVTGTQP